MPSTKKALGIPEHLTWDLGTLRRNVIEWLVVLQAKHKLYTTLTSGDFDIFIQITDKAVHSEEYCFHIESPMIGASYFVKIWQSDDDGDNCSRWYIVVLNEKRENIKKSLQNLAIFIDWPFRIHGGS